MFTADGLRPDSPHLMPPRGAACVLSLSLSFCPVPRVFVPLLARDLSHSHPSFRCSLTLTRPCLSYLCRPFHVHATLSLYLASFHESLTLLTSHPAPWLFYGQRKGGEFGPWKQERTSARERTDSRERDSDITEHEERTETTNSPGTYMRMIDSTRIRGEFICKGVVNGGREYGGGCRLAVSLLLHSISIVLLSFSFFPLYPETFLPSSFKYLSSSTIYSCLYLSCTVFSSLFNVTFELSKDKFDVSVVCARARACFPLFASLPFSRSLVSLLVSLRHGLRTLARMANDDVTKHVTIV